MARGQVAAALWSLSLAPLAAAWKKTLDGDWVPCTHTKVLLDTATGWPGLCLGLERRAISDTGFPPGEEEAACSQACVDDVLCTVWQLTADGACYAGSQGLNCWTRNQGEHSNFVPAAAERIQHGEVTVLEDFTSTWVEGLFKVGYFESDETLGAERCKLQCYSDVLCSFWQYGYEGCWLERAPDYIVPKLPVMSNTSSEAMALVAGQHILHFCPAPVGESKYRDLYLGFVILGGVLALAALMSMVYHLCLSTPRPSQSKRTRALRVTLGEVAPPASGEPSTQGKEGASARPAYQVVAQPLRPPAALAYQPLGVRTPWPQAAGTTFQVVQGLPPPGGKVVHVRSN